MSTVDVERVIDLPGRGIGLASSTIVEVGQRRGYTVGATGPGTFRLERATRPVWATALAIVLMPVLGLGLIFLRVRTRESGVITVFEDRAGTRARIIGVIDDELVDHLGAAPQSGTQASVGEHPRSATARTAVSEVAPTAGPVAPIPSSAASRPVSPTKSSILISSTPSRQRSVGDVTRPQSEQHHHLGRNTEPSVDRDIDRTIARPKRHTTAGDGAASSWRVDFPDGRRLSLDGPLIIGRGPAEVRGSTSIAVADPSLSKTHVRIERNGGAVVITDQHSTNGTVVRSGDSDVACLPGVGVTVERTAVVIAGTAELTIVEIAT